MLRKQSRAEQRRVRCDGSEFALIGSVPMIGACIKAYIAGYGADKARMALTDWNCSMVRARCFSRARKSHSISKPAPPSRLFKVHAIWADPGYTDQVLLGAPRSYEVSAAFKF
jgi:hypothetical protein